MHLVPILVALAACTPASEPPLSDETADTANLPTATDTTDTTDTDTDVPQGGCGEVTTWDLMLSGTVTDGFDLPIAGATIVLEDRGWMPVTQLANTVSDVDGAFQLTIEGLTSVEDCWGTLLDYVVTGESQLGQVGEEDVNPELFAAIQDGSLEADLLGSLVLDYPE